MPIDAFQQAVLQLLAKHRSPDTFIAGATAISAASDSPRFSQDIDINHDIEESVAESASRDAQALIANGYAVQWRVQQAMFARAIVEKGADRVKLEWVFDSAFRFFPVEADPLCGWRLNLFDAATNKVLALAGRVQPRDFLDIIHLHETTLSFGALSWAAAGKDLGMNPRFILEEARRTAHYTGADFSAIKLRHTLDLGRIYTVWRAALADAERLIDCLPANEVGCLYLNEQNVPVTPDPASPNFPKLKRHFGSVRGAWPVIRN
jgi:predicted nucleotidyltransferase component of viral defense system